MSAVYGGGNSTQLYLESATFHEDKWHALSYIRVECDVKSWQTHGSALGPATHCTCVSYEIIKQSLK
jgi:hypothetical protein